MANPYILAKTMKDAHAFARESLDLRPGRYRVVTSSSSISGPRGADLYLVPGWEERYDRFAVKGALRYTRLNVIDVATAEVFLVKAPEPQTDGLIPAGTQLTLDDASAFFDDVPPPVMLPDRVDTLQAISDEIAAVEDAHEPQAEKPDWVKELEESGAIEPEGFSLSSDPDVQAEQIIKSAAHFAPPAPAEPEKKRRRTRCKSCDTLHFKDEPCPEAE